MVASTDLYFDDIINDVSHCLEVGTAAIRGPVSDVEMTHLMSLIVLERGRERERVCVCVFWNEDYPRLGGDLSTQGRVAETFY